MPDHADLMRPTKEMFRHWARYRDGTIPRAMFVQLMQPIRQQIDSLLLRGAFSGNAKLVGLCEPLYDHREHLWTFVDVEGVEPTNNASERAPRPAVIWRKLSFGTQSAQDSCFVERILTVVEDCHRQSRNSFAFLPQAVQAHLDGQAAPSLLAGVCTATNTRVGAADWDVLLQSRHHCSLAWVREFPPTFCGIGSKQCVPLSDSFRHLFLLADRRVGGRFRRVRFEGVVFLCRS